MTGMIDLTEYMNMDLEGDFWFPGEESSKFHGYLNFSYTKIGIKTSGRKPIKGWTLEVLHGDIEKTRYRHNFRYSHKP